MVKLSFPLRRLPNLTREQFQKYWYETHGPLVRSHAKTLKIKRYVQVHTLSDPLNAVLRQSREALEEFDGVAELWWESRGDFESALAAPEGQKAAAILLEDERKFIDLKRSALWIANERPIVES